MDFLVRILYRKAAEARISSKSLTTPAGSRICRAAAHRGWSVTSISRSGTPHWSSVTSSPNPPEWSESVSWQKGDVLDPSSYTQHLEGASAVIHTMGILLEADYKGVVSGRESPIAGLKRAFSSTKQGTQDPLSVKEGEALRPMERDGQLTYEVMNRDTGTFGFNIACTWRLMRLQRYRLRKNPQSEKSPRSSIYQPQRARLSSPRDTSRQNARRNPSSARRFRICARYSSARHSCTTRRGRSHCRLQLQAELRV